MPQTIAFTRVRSRSVARLPRARHGRGPQLPEESRDSSARFPTPQLAFGAVFGRELVARAVRLRSSSLTKPAPRAVFLRMSGAPIAVARHVLAPDSRAAAAWHAPCFNEIPDSGRLKPQASTKEIWMRGFEEASA